MKDKLDELLLVLTSWGCDRWVHLVASLVIALLTAILIIITSAATQCFVEHSVVGIISVLVTAAIGLLKELYDKKTIGLFDVDDLAADFIGAALFFAIFSL